MNSTHLFETIHRLRANVQWSVLQEPGRKHLTDDLLRRLDELEELAMQRQVQEQKAERIAGTTLKSYLLTLRH